MASTWALTCGDICITDISLMTGAPSPNRLLLRTNTLNACDGSDWLANIPISCNMAAAQHLFIPVVAYGDLSNFGKGFAEISHMFRMGLIKIIFSPSSIADLPIVYSVGPHIAGNWI